jgi:hypothetical protein
MSSTKDTSAEELLSAAIGIDSVSQLNMALEQVVSCGSVASYQDFVNSALLSAVQNGCLSLTTHLLNEEDASVSVLTPIHISTKPSIPLFEVLLAHGWDLNLEGPRNSIHKGKRVIDWVCENDGLTQWLVEHGASVDGGMQEYAVEARPPMLLETCAALGSVETFRLMRLHGAKLGKRVLHVAVSEGAALGADPASVGDRSDASVVTIGDEEHKNRARRRVEMLLFLVDELKLDVNTLDSDDVKAKHWGPPLNYAAKEKNGAAVVRWLLTKGADPQLNSAGGLKAADIAKSFKATDVLEALPH